MNDNIVSIDEHTEVVNDLKQQIDELKAKKQIYRVCTNVPNNWGYDKYDLELFDDLEKAKEYFDMLKTDGAYPYYALDEDEVEEGTFIELEHINTGRIIDTFVFCDDEVDYVKGVDKEGFEVRV